VGTLESPHSYLLLEVLPGKPLAEIRHRLSADQLDRLMTQLAEMVVAMHGVTAEHYGRCLPDQAPVASSWPAFFREMYDPIWKECQSHAHVPSKCRKSIERVHEKLDRLLAHHDLPRLTHGDLWGNNVLAEESGGQWNITAILDPNCKFSHAEEEIAYLDLFRTITPSFKAVYQQTFKLADDYHRFRKPVYQLYPLINHVNLFGDKFLPQMQQMLEKVSALV
jgi:fructosamine-3-kinase